MTDHFEGDRPQQEPDRGQRFEPARAQPGAPSKAGRASAGARPWRWRLGIVAAVVAVAVVVAVIASTGGGSRSASAAATATASAAQRIELLLAGIPQNGNALGSSSAPVTLEYFGDLECPIARRFTIGALPLLIRRWVRDGKLRIEYRSIQSATSSAATFRTQQVAAQAAGAQDKMWDYVEFFYHEQGRLSSGYVSEKYLQNLARQVPGLNIARWTSARDDSALAKQVAADQRAAAKIGFSVSPSFLVKRSDGRASVKLTQYSTVEPGAFNDAIEKMLSA
jgi:protein-disulfide isomerase